MGNYDEWKDEYYNLEKVDLKKYFTEKDFSTLKNLGISILDKIYTENEFEILYSKVLSNYDENDNIKENLNVKEEEFVGLVKKLDDINKLYDF